MQARNGSITSNSIQHQRFQQTVAESVLKSAQRGDRGAHAVLYQTYSQAVYTLALGICRNQHCAEDVLHNTYIKLIDKLPMFEGRAPLGMWIRQIAVNESLMYLRKHKKHRAVMSTDEFDFLEGQQDEQLNQAFCGSSANLDGQFELQADMSQLLHKLPDDVRTVLWLKEVEGYTHNEIADLVDKTPSYSKSVVARALQFLRTRSLQQDNFNVPAGEL